MLEGPFALLGLSDGQIPEVGIAGHDSDDSKHRRIGFENKCVLSNMPNIQIGEACEVIVRVADSRQQSQEVNCIIEAIENGTRPGHARIRF